MEQSGLLNWAEYADVVRCAPIICVDLLCRDDHQRLLLGLRTAEPARGFWFTPGGRVRKDERLVETVARVLADELGIALESVQPATLVGVFQHFYSGNRFADPRFGTHCVVLAFEITLDAHIAVNLQPADKQHGALAWMTLDEIRSSPEVHDHIREYFV